MTQEAHGSVVEIFLTWLERALLVTGTVLGIWCAFVLVRAEYYRRMPVPPTPAVAGPVGTVGTLPGETPGENTPPRHTAVAVGSWIARMEAPSVNLAATVLEGSDDATLSRAAGHIEDTAFPGEAGNVGIAGHRDTTFRAVRKLKLGEPLILTTADRVFRYQINRTIIVDPEDVWVLDPTAHQTLTLVTCYPFDFIGHAPRRYIVGADLVGVERRPSESSGAEQAGGARKVRSKRAVEIIR